MNPELNGPLLNNSDELGDGEPQALVGTDERGMANTGNDKAGWDFDAAKTVVEKDSTSKVSPFPFPEEIIRVLIDILRAEKDEEFDKHELEHLLYTQKAIEHTQGCRDYDNVLKNLSLVSRLWTQPVRQVLGRKLVLIMDAKELRAGLRAVETPVYGTWTQHVEILEVPYTAAQDGDYIEGIWRMAGRIVSHLGNVRTFLFSSSILGSTSTGLRHVLSSMKNLEELTLRNTFSMSPIDHGDGDVHISIQSPHLEKMSFEGCRPVLEDTSEHSDALAIRGASDVSQQLHTIKSLFSGTTEHCFGGESILLIFNERKRTWSIDKLRVSLNNKSCGGRCVYEDVHGVCANVRSLDVVLTQEALSSCLFKVFSVCIYVEALNLSLTNPPTEGTLDALPKALEDVYISFSSVQTVRDLATVDKYLLQFCETRRNVLRRLNVSSMNRRNKTLSEEAFLSTKAFCSKHRIEFDFEVF